MLAIMITCLILLQLSAVIVAACTVYKYHKKQISRKTFFVFIIYAAIMSSLGISLAIWYRPFDQYSPLHLINVLFFTYSGFILLYGAKEHAKRIVWGFMVCFVILNLARIPYLWIYEGYTFFSILPLHLCGISGVFLIARPFYLKGKSKFTKEFSKIIDNDILCFAFLGALLNFFFPPTHAFGELGFFHLRTIVSNVLHWVFITATIYLLLSGEIKPSKKLAVMNLLWLVPAYVMFIFVNSYMGTNFFFTNGEGNPIGFLYNMFPMWEWQLGVTIVEVNPIYWVAMIFGTTLSLLAVSAMFEQIHKKFGEKTETNLT